MMSSMEPLELPLPRRVETSATKLSAGLRKAEPLAAGYVAPEGSVSSPAGARCDMMSMGGRGVPTKLFVGGVSAHTTTEALRAHFSKYGRIIDAVVMQKNGRPRGFGFVTYDNPMPADLVLAEAQWLDGRLVDVKRAVPGERAQERASNKIFVGGLPQDVGTDELRAYFSGYGAVADSVVMVDRRTNRSRGFGFVRFGNGVQGNAASEAVLMDFASHRLAGKWIEVKRATPASQLQDMYPGQEFDEEMVENFGGMNADEIMAAMTLGVNPLDYMGMSMVGWDGSPCGDSTPMSMASMAMSMEGGSAGSTRSHARGRRARRRKQREQKPGCNDDEDVSDDEESTATGPFSMGGTPLGEVAFVSMSNSASANASPTAGACYEPSFPTAAGVAAWDIHCDIQARALGPVAADRSYANMAANFGGNTRQQKHSSNKITAAAAGGASENDPSRANAISTTRTNEPMKILSRNNGNEAAPEAFTRDDFLSLEVGGGSWGPAW